MATNMVLSSTLDLFRKPQTDYSIESYRMVTIQPTTTGINPMEFIIPKLESFVDLNRSYFTMELQMKKSDGNNWVNSETLWPANNIAHTIIKQIDLYLNGTLISPQSDTYHYKAYLQTLTNFDTKDGRTVLRPAGWFNGINPPPQWTANNVNTAANSGAGHSDYQNLAANTKLLLANMSEERNELAAGKVRHYVFVPHLEVFHTGKALVPGVEIKMRFHFNDPKVFLDGVGKAGRLTESDIKIRFHVCQLRLNEAVYRSLESKRHNGKAIAKYPTVRSEIRTYSMENTKSREEIRDLFQNRIPDRMIVALLDSRAFNGAYDRNCFCFQKFDLTSIKQIVRGEEYPYETLDLVGNDSSRDLLGYFRYLLASGAWCHLTGNMLEEKDWGEDKGCTLFMIDNVANGCADSRNLNPKQSGDLQLKLDFRAAPASNITILVYGEFENLLEIDPNGSVLYDIYQH